MLAKHNELPPLTEAQLEIMSLIWQEGQATVADVWKVMHERRGLARNTVQTTLVRLEEKGYLRHRQKGNAFVYFPKSRRDTTLRQMLRGMVEVAFQGSTAGLVMTLLENAELSDEETGRIRELLERNKSNTKEREP